MSKRLPLDTPLVKGNALAAFVESIDEMAQACAAWSRFGEDTMAFLKSKGLLKQFERYRAKRETAK